METVIFRGIDADGGVGAEEFGPGIGGDLDAVLSVHIALKDSHAVGVAGEEDHGVRAAVAAPHLDKVAGSCLGKEIAHRGVAGRREIRNTANQGGIAGRNANLIVVGLALRGTDVIAEQNHMHLFGKALALLVGIFTSISCSGTIDPISVAAVGHILEAVIDLLLGIGQGGRRSCAAGAIFVIVRGITPGKTIGRAGGGIEDLVFAAGGGDQIDGIALADIVAAGDRGAAPQRAVERSRTGGFGMGSVVIADGRKGDVGIDTLAGGGIGHIGPVFPVGNPPRQSDTAHPSGCRCRRCWKRHR